MGALGTIGKSLLGMTGIGMVPLGIMEYEKQQGARTSGMQAWQEALAASGGDRHAAAVNVIRSPAFRDGSALANSPDLLKIIDAALTAPDPQNQPASVQEAQFMFPEDPEAQRQMLQQNYLSEQALKQAQIENLQRPPQGPQAPADIQMLEYVARRRGLDLSTEEGFRAAVAEVQKLSTQNVNQFNFPTGYGPTGQLDANGLPVMAPASGSPDQVKAEAQQNELVKGAEILKTGLAALDKHPEEFGLLGKAKQAGRAIAGAGAQLGIPGAEELRTGPLAEPQELGTTMAEVDIVFNRLSSDLARSGLDPNSNEFKAAQAEIESIRKEMSTGQPDLNTTKRKLLALGRVVYGDLMGEVRQAPPGATPPAGPKTPIAQAAESMNTAPKSGGTQATQVYPEGTVIVNDQTGERMVKKNGRWQPQ
jgi:hypothetical protein